MEEDIQNYSPTVMFRGTPCILSFEFFIEPEVHLYTLLLKGEDLVADAAEVGLEGRE